MGVDVYRLTKGIGDWIYFYDEYDDVPLINADLRLYSLTDIPICWQLTATGFYGILI